MGIGLKAGAVMTTGAATVRPAASLSEAARVMIEHRISGLPVLSEEGELVGLITERDFLRQEDGTRPRWLDVILNDAAVSVTACELQNRRVRDVMSRNPLTVEADAPVEAVLEIMERHNVKRLPVLRSGKVVGIISRADILRAIMRKADSASTPLR
jgi:CBS domain-containing protein